MMNEQVVEPGVRVRVAMTVNGEAAEALIDPSKTLLEVLREDLQLAGTKHGCELGECGACAVLVDGEPVLSCLALGVESGGRTIVTIEGMAEGGRLHPLQETFADLGGSQCGYCTPGILLTAKALLDREPHPSRELIKEALSGNLCRCTGYLQIFEAVEAAAERLAQSDDDLHSHRHTKMEGRGFSLGRSGQGSPASAKATAVRRSFSEGGSPGPPPVHGSGPSRSVSDAQGTGTQRAHGAQDTAEGGR